MTFLITAFSKIGPKEIMFRYFKNFDQEIFSEDLRTSLSSEAVDDYTRFEENFLEVLNKHAPLKKKVLRANHAAYVTKVFRKAFMKRSYLEKLYFGKKSNRNFEKV